MAIRLLIDECLSPILESVARDQGYEAIHINHRGYSGRSDAAIFRLMVDEAYTLVTNNQGDFDKLIGQSELHPGLIVFTASVRRERQKQMLQKVLDHVGMTGKDDLINKVIEVDVDLRVAEYELPTGRIGMVNSGSGAGYFYPLCADSRTVSLASIRSSGSPRSPKIAPGKLRPAIASLRESPGENRQWIRRP